MEIVALPERPEAIVTCARWAFETWGGDRVDSAAEAARLWRKELAAPGLPLRWVAVAGSEVLGMASLVADDLPARPDLTPWLADVFVPPERRGRGIATALVGTVERAAAGRGLTKLYLHTEHAVGLYARLGWREIGRERDGHDRPVTLMEKALA